MNKPLFHNTSQLPGAPAEADLDSVTSLAAGSLGPYHRPHDPLVLPELAAGAAPRLRTNLRKYRRNFTIACTAFTAGAILILFSSDSSRELIAPGPLSSQHAPLASLEGGDRCAVCHAAQNQSFGSWVSSLFLGQPDRGVAQSELCMNCHADSFSSEHALNPHNVCPAELNKVTARISGSAAPTTPGWAGAHPEINCSTCHQEHHGGDQLTSLTDSQCQTCHSQSFQSFEQGHPEFTQYAQQRRSRIAFDHAAHFGRHFIEKKQSIECSFCHQADSYQNVMRLAPYKQTCAQCHNDQILDSASDGLVLLSLPMLDMQAIEAAGLNVGSWPLAATGDFDGELPPLMRVLLLADPAAKEILVARGAKFEFLDFDAENRQDVQQAVDLVWAIKRLLGALATDGPLELKRRFELAAKAKLSVEQLDQMISTLDHSVFYTLAGAWLPDLQQELEASKSGQANRTEALFEALTAQLPLVAESRDLSDSGNFKPTDSVGRSGSGSRSEFFLAKTSRPSQPRDELLAVNPLSKLMATAKEVGNPEQSANTAEVGAEIAAERPQIAESTGAEPLPLAESTTPVVSESHSANRQDLAADARNLSLKLPAAQDANSPTSSAPSAYLANDHNQVLFDGLKRPSGWYRDDTRLRVSYRAAGHADPCLHGWIEFVASIPNLEQQPDLEPLVKKILSPQGVGQCQSCHTVDRRRGDPSGLEDGQSQASLLVNWLPHYRDPALRGFTKFSHAPHLVHVELKDCTKCHELDLNRSNTSSFVSFDSSEVFSNFRPIVKNDCLSCHQQGRTNSSCMQCHHYHVEVGR